MGDFRRIRLSTNADRDIGWFVIFVGLVACVPIFHMLQKVGLLHVGYEMGMVVGLGLILLGVVLIFLSPKFISISKELIVVKDGFFRRKVRYRWQEHPKIKLQSVNQDGNAQSLWTVDLADGPRRYNLDTRSGTQMASRTLAETIAKTIGCAVVEEVDGQAVEIPLSELDLPFVRRVQKHPELLGPEFQKPEGSRFDHSSDAEGLKFRWGPTDSGLWLEVAVTVIVLLSFSLVPLPTAKDGVSFSILDLARLEGSYTYFYVVGGLAVIALFLIAGYRIETRASKQNLTVLGRLWGIPIRSMKIAVDKLEGISVHLSNRGALLQFISDERILSERLADTDTARWIACKIRRYYASLGAAQAAEE